MIKCFVGKKIFCGQFVGKKIFCRQIYLIIPNWIPNITNIKPRGTMPQNSIATYFNIPSLYLIGTPSVLNNDKKPCLKCVAIKRIEIIYIIAVGV